MQNTNLPSSIRTPEQDPTQVLREQIAFETQRLIEMFDQGVAKRIGYTGNESIWELSRYYVRNLRQHTEKPLPPEVAKHVLGINGFSYRMEVPNGAFVLYQIDSFGNPAVSISRGKTNLEIEAGSDYNGMRFDRLRMKRSDYNPETLRSKLRKIEAFYPADNPGDPDKPLVITDANLNITYGSIVDREGDVRLGNDTLIGLDSDRTFCRFKETSGGIVPEFVINPNKLQFDPEIGITGTTGKIIFPVQTNIFNEIQTMLNNTPGNLTGSYFLT